MSTEINSDLACADGGFRHQANEPKTRDAFKVAALLTTPPPSPPPFSVF